MPLVLVVYQNSNPIFYEWYYRVQLRSTFSLSKSYLLDTILSSPKNMSTLSVSGSGLVLTILTCQTRVKPIFDPSRIRRLITSGMRVVGSTRGQAIWTEAKLTSCLIATAISAMWLRTRKRGEPMMARPGLLCSPSLLIYF